MHMLFYQNLSQTLRLNFDIFEPIKDQNCDLISKYWFHQCIKDFYVNIYGKSTIVLEKIIKFEVGF